MSKEKKQLKSIIFVDSEFPESNEKIVCHDACYFLLMNRKAKNYCSVDPIGCCLECGRKSVCKNHKCNWKAPCGWYPVYLKDFKDLLKECGVIHEITDNEYFKLAPEMNTKLYEKTLEHRKELGLKDVDYRKHL